MDAICALASSCNNGKPCQVIDRKNGSFNACFFVKFGQGGPEWAIKVPIEPVLDNPWDKVLSEVATIEQALLVSPASITIHAFTDTWSETPRFRSLTFMLTDVMLS